MRNADLVFAGAGSLVAPAESGISKLNGALRALLALNLDGLQLVLCGSTTFRRQMGLQDGDCGIVLQCSTMAHSRQ
jgi:hypothetical protein